jgi:hypothetical protein
MLLCELNAREGDRGERDRNRGIEKRQERARGCRRARERNGAGKNTRK